MTFAQRLRDLRSQNDMTQQELADSTHIARSTLAMYEYGKRRPDFEILDKLADYFDVSFDYLLGRSAVNHGYPRHDIVVATAGTPITIEHEDTPDKDGFYARVAAYYNGIGLRIAQAYDKASPDTQAAVRAILHVEETPDADS